jgi:hypothetical protein
MFTPARPLTTALRSSRTMASRSISAKVPLLLTPAEFKELPKVSLSPMAGRASTPDCDSRLQSPWIVLGICLTLLGLLSLSTYLDLGSQMPGGSI